MGRFARADQHNHADAIGGQQSRQCGCRYTLGVATQRYVQIVAGLEFKQGAALGGIVTKAPVQMHGGERSARRPSIDQLFFQRRQCRGSQYLDFGQGAEPIQGFQ